VTVHAHRLAEAVAALNQGSSDDLAAKEGDAR